MSPRRTLVGAMAGALAVALTVASRDASADAGPKARALTDLDDAHACLPLEGGAMAVASGGGLALVAADGSVRTLTSLDGLPDTRVYALARDGDALWVGTDGGAARVKLGPAPVVTRVVAVANAPVHAVLATSSGVFVGTWGAGVVHLASPEAAPELVRSSVTGKRVAALAVQGGFLYVAYADGPLAKLDGGVLEAVAGTPSHGQSLVSSVAKDGGSALVLGDLEGLYRLDEAVTPMASVDARGLASSGTDILVATYGGGLLAGPASGPLRRESSVARFVRGVAVRGDDRCAATTEGVFVDRGGSGWKKLALGSIPSNDVTALEVSGDRVAVATFDHGAAIVHGDRTDRIAGLEPTETVNTALWQGEGSAAILWLGTAHGIVRVGPGGTVRRIRAADGLPSSVVRALVVLPDGRLLVGTDDGAAYLQGDHVTPLVPPGKTPVPLASPMHATWALAVGRDGTMWIGTMAGLYVGQGGSFRRVSVATGDLRDDWITALAIHDDDVFVGTYAGGVTRLRPGTSASRFEHVHLGGGNINPAGVVFVGDKLYAATMEGLLVRGAADADASWQPVSGAAPGRDVTAVRKVGAATWVASRRGIGAL